VPLQPGTYLIAAYDKTGNRSANANAIVTTVPAVSGLNAVETVSEAAPFTAQAGGITVGCAASGAGNATFTWGNLTEVLDTSPAGMDATAACDLQAAPFGPVSVTLNGTATSAADAGAMVVASFR
jgi:hypothetical protein